MLVGFKWFPESLGLLGESRVSATVHLTPATVPLGSFLRWTVYHLHK